MSTASLVARIQPFAKTRPVVGNGSILELIQRAQTQLFSSNPLGLRFVPSDNKGFPFYLKTSNNNYKYLINSTNLASALTVTIGSTDYAVRANKILRVFVDVTTTNYSGYMLGDPYEYRFGTPSSVPTERIWVTDVPIKRFNGNELTAPSIQFFDNPGDSTAKYFVEFTYLPPQLTAITIPLMVPEEFEDALFDYAIGDIRFLENGVRNEFQDRFENKWKPEFIKDADSGIQYVDTQTVIREC